MTMADQHCLACEYDLRGLTGDPVRCPECGYENSAEDLALPRSLLERELRVYEAMPTLCVAGAWVATAGGVAVVLRAAAWGAALVLLGLAIWGLAACAFMFLADRRGPWLSALLWIHVVHAIWLAVIGGIAACAFVGFNWMSEHGWWILMGLIMLVGGVLQWLRPAWFEQLWQGGPYGVARRKLWAVFREDVIARARRRPR